MTEERCEPKVPTPPGTLHLIQDWRDHPIAAIWRGGEHSEWITYDYDGLMTLRRGDMIARDGYRYIAPIPHPAEIEALHLLIADLSTNLTDEGDSYFNESLHKMRRRVANALPRELCPDWLAPYRSTPNA